MAQRNSVSGGVKRPITRGARRATDNPWFERFARFGYAAKRDKTDHVAMHKGAALKKAHD